MNILVEYLVANVSAFEASSSPPDCPRVGPAACIVPAEGEPPRSRLGIAGSGGRFAFGAAAKLHRDGINGQRPGSSRPPGPPATSARLACLLGHFDGKESVAGMVAIPTALLRFSCRQQYLKIFLITEFARQMLAMRRFSIHKHLRSNMVLATLVLNSKRFCNESLALCQELHGRPRGQPATIGVGQKRLRVSVSGQCQAPADIAVAQVQHRRCRRVS